VLANTTSVGMQPNVEETPVPAAALQAGGFAAGDYTRPLFSST